MVPVDYRASSAFLLRIRDLVDARVVWIGDEVVWPEAAEPRPWRFSEVDWAEIDRSGARTAPPETVGRDDVAEIVFTSGATADPKGVIITHRNILANVVPVETEIRKYRRYGGPFFPLRFLNLLPLSHMFGQAMATFIPPILPGVVVFMRGYNPEEILRQIRERRDLRTGIRAENSRRSARVRRAALSRGVHRVASGVRWPRRWWHYRRIHRLFGWKFWAFVVGAAPLPPDVEEFWSRLGFLTVQGYGLTETAPIVTLNHPFHTRRGTVGKPIGGVEVKIAPDGEILVRGENVSSGYYGLALDSSFEDGWLHTGDIGEFDTEGRLSVRGRKKEMIVTPEGLNVFPEDIERVLDEIPGVKESAAVGQDRVHAVLVLEPGADVGRHRPRGQQQARRSSAHPGCEPVAGTRAAAHRRHGQAEARGDLAVGELRPSGRAIANRQRDRAIDREIRRRANAHAGDYARRAGAQLPGARRADDSVGSERAGFSGCANFGRSDVYSRTTGESCGGAYAGTFHSGRGHAPLRSCAISAWRW